jgi:hypothetical protein
MEGGCDGKVLRCGAGERHQEPYMVLLVLYCITRCRLSLYRTAVIPHYHLPEAGSAARSGLSSWASYSTLQYSCGGGGPNGLPV